MSKRVVLSSERTLRECKRRGWRAGKVERFVQQAGPYGKRFDLFGWIDVIAQTPEDGEFLPGVVAIQSCSMSTRAAHLAKMAEPEIAASIRDWVRAGCAAELWSWRKLKMKRGGIAVRWAVEVTPLGVEKPHEIAAGA